MEGDRIRDTKQLSDCGKVKFMNTPHARAQLLSQHIRFSQDWEQDSSAECPKELTALLDADDQLHLFGIFDGTRRAAVLGVNDLDTLPSEVAARPLLRPDTDEGEAGPWLLSFGRLQGKQASVLRHHLCKFHGRGVGILLLTTATETDLQSHLRGLVKVAADAEAKRMLFFRYWDPVTANEFLPSLDTQPARLERFFYTQSGTPIQFLCEQGRDGLNAFHVTGPAKQPGVRKFFTLEECDTQVMARIARTGLGHNLSRWLERDYADELCADADFDELGPHILREGQRFGFTRQDEYAYLGHMMVHLGGWFHQSGQAPALTHILASDARAKHIALREVFPEAWAGSYCGVRRDWGDQVLADPQLRVSDGGEITLCPDREVIAACLQRQIPKDKQEPFRALWAKSQTALVSDDAAEKHLPQIAFLSLFWGYRFYEDPFLGRKQAPHSSLDWEMVCNDFWKALIDV